MFHNLHIKPTIPTQLQRALNKALKAYPKAKTTPGTLRPGLKPTLTPVPNYEEYFTLTSPGLSLLDLYQLAELTCERYNAGFRNQGKAKPTLIPCWIMSRDLPAANKLLASPGNYVYYIRIVRHGFPPKGPNYTNFPNDPL